MALSGTKALLVWSQRTTEGYKDVNVTNMQKSWKDGLAFCAILHHYRPDLIDFSSLSKENVRENNRLAFDVAEHELGIPALLDPDDMATMHVPDKLSIMTYVSQYYNYFRDKKPIKDSGGPKTRTASKRQAGESPLQHKPNKQPTLGDTCAVCSKKVYLVERQVADGKLYHHSCFRCTKCSTTLRPGGYKTTADPKKLECLEHGDNIWKLRSNIASRASKEKKQPSEEGSIWEARPGAKGEGGSPWEKQGANPAPRESGGVASIWEERSGLKPVPRDGSSSGGPWDKQAGSQDNAKIDQGKSVLPSHKPPVPGPFQQPASKPAVPMHPHLLASKASRERFNSPAATQETKPVQQFPPKPSPAGSPPSLASPEKKLDSDAGKTEATRQGLLASLAAVRGNVKPGTAASKEVLLDALDGGTGRKLAIGEEDSQEASPASSNWSLLSDAKEDSKSPSKDDSKSPNKDEENNLELPQEVEKLPDTDEMKDDSTPLAESHSRDSGHTSSDVFSLTSISSISHTNNSETSSLDTDPMNFASGIDPAKRSSALSRDSISDHEGVSATHLNLSDSFCVEYDSKADEPASETPNKEEVPTDAKMDTEEKQNERGVKEDLQADKQDTKPEETSKDDYDESLNPFGDDEEEEEEVVKEKKDDGYKNPFDTDSDEEEDAYDDSLNPFGGDDDVSTPGSPVSQWPPLPAGGSSKPAEIPNQAGSYKVKTRQEILQEMQRDRNTLKAHQKRPAPPRPGGPPHRPDGPPHRPEGAPPRPRAPSDKHLSPNYTEKGAMRPPRRSCKSRPAPAPPTENGSLADHKEHKPRPDRPPPPSTASRDQRADSDSSTKPVPSPRLKTKLTPSKEDTGRISPVPSPRKKRGEGLKIEELSPVPSPRMRRATHEPFDRQKIKPPRPTSDPIKPPTPPTHGSSRKRAPAPPPIKREVDKHHVDTAIIQKELCEIEIQQRELEAKGIKLEESLRSDMQGQENQDNEELLVEWFALVNERNQLLRREGELVAQAQMQDLELQQAEIEYELRCLMHKHEHQKTDADNEREEKLLEMLVEAVTKRSQIVERLEDDRKREEAEDEDIQSMMEQSVPKKEKGKNKKGLDKKNMEKKKQKKKKATGLLGK